MEEGWKTEIKHMSYKEMLSLQRFAPVGHQFFTGEIGNYFSEIMAEKRNEITDQQHSEISKELGWGRMNNIQINISIPEQWKKELRKLARVESVNQDKDLTYLDLVRIAIKEKYSLGVTNEL